MATSMEEILMQGVGETPLLDAALVAQVKDFEGMWDITEQVVVQRLEEMAELRDETDGEMDADQMEAFGNSAHAFKSGMAQVGAQRLALVCYQMEIYGRKTKFQNREALLHLYDNVLFGVLQETLPLLQEAFGVAEEEEET
eukprot:m.64637 g.64637  ORF g.64637 m.64637 type:complete len:141 (+) comp19563_c0_seq2:327-749(+)